MQRLSTGRLFFFGLISRISCHNPFERMTQGFEGSTASTSITLVLSFSACSNGLLLSKYWPKFKEVLIALIIYGTQQIKKDKAAVRDLWLP